MYPTRAPATGYGAAEKNKKAGIVPRRAHSADDGPGTLADRARTEYGSAAGGRRPQGGVRPSTARRRRPNAAAPPQAQRGAQEDATAAQPRAASTLTFNPESEEHNRYEYRNQMPEDNGRELTFFWGGPLETDTSSTSSVFSSGFYSQPSVSSPMALKSPLDSRAASKVYEGAALNGRAATRRHSTLRQSSTGAEYSTAQSSSAIPSTDSRSFNRTNFGASVSGSGGGPYKSLGHHRFVPVSRRNAATEEEQA